MPRELIWAIFKGVAILRDAFAFVSIRDALKHRAARTRLLRRAREFGASIGTNVEVIGLERLALGEGTVIQSNVTLHCGGMDWADARGRIRIGRNGFVGHGCVLYGAGGIDIGDDVLISPGVIFASHQHSYISAGVPTRLQPTLFSPILVASNVWIGSAAIILPGVSLGEGCVVAAGAVVSRSVPASTLVAGVPARIAKEFRAVADRAESFPLRT